MTSSQPVVTPNAINFTPDNKEAYAFSGIIAVTNSATTLLEFNTNSEYIKGTIQVLQGTTSNEDFQYDVYFNDVVIARWHCLQVTDKETNIPNAYDVTIPPFTKVTITGLNTSSATGRNHSVTLTGKAIGMTEVGYQ